MKKYLKYSILCLLSIIFLGTIYIGYRIDDYNQGNRNLLNLIKTKFTEKEKVNLIICGSPLQMLIAEKIIEQNPNEKFYFVLISFTKNDKFTHYFQRLQEKTSQAYFFKFPTKEYYPNFFKFSLLELRLKSFLLPEVKRIYLANINSVEVQTLINYHRKAEIKTFDDGTINLVNSDLQKNTDILRNTPYKNIFNPDLDTQTLTKASTEHYTIFKNLKNKFDNNQRKITHIELFKKEDLPTNNQNEIKDTIKIFLGLVDNNRMLEISEKVIDKYNIEYVSLHPRQKEAPKNAKVIETPLVLEDFLIQELKKNPHTLYHIYTFFSSAALNIKDFPRVEITALKHKKFPKKESLREVYPLFTKSGIKIENID